MASRRSDRDLDDTYRMFNEINIIAQLSANAFARVLPHGLTLSQFAVLNWFARVDDVATPGRLARAFQISKGAMTNTLTRLADKAFVTIEPDPASARSKHVRMTAAGRRARDDAIAASAPLLADVLAHVGARQVRDLLPTLEALRIHLDRARDGAAG
jgi:DNA-binding MarR family transcriptional regulator